MHDAISSIDAIHASNTRRDQIAGLFNIEVRHKIIYFRDLIPRYAAVICA